MPDATMPGHVNDRPPNFRNADGRLYLVRCYACGGKSGTENYALAVAAGECCRCGWREETAMTETMRRSHDGETRRGG